MLFGIGMIAVIWPLAFSLNRKLHTLIYLRNIIGMCSELISAFMYHILILLSLCVCRDKYDAIEVKALAYLPSVYVDKQIPYKYYVHHSNGSHCPEYNHDISFACNRCLELGYHRSGNTYSKKTFCIKNLIITFR